MEKREFCEENAVHFAKEMKRFIQKSFSLQSFECSQSIEKHLEKSFKSKSLKYSREKTSAINNHSHLWSWRENQNVIRLKCLKAINF